MKNNYINLKDIDSSLEGWQCEDCGAFTLSSDAKDVKHHDNCTPGESKKWEEFYEGDGSD